MKRALINCALLVVLVAGILASCKGKVDNPPIAKDINISTQEDTPVSISLKGSDPEGNIVSYILLSTPGKGSLSGTEPNLVYTPDRDFYGLDRFAYKVNDGIHDSNSAVVTINVTPINDPPQAIDDVVKVEEDSSMVSIDVLKNDIDIDGDEITVLGAAEGDYGSIVISSDNRNIVYTPNKNFSNADTFTYTISDSKGGTDTGSVRIDIIPVNDPPVIKSRPETTARVWGTYNYQVKATDPDSGDKLNYSLITKPEGMEIDSDTGMIEWKPTGTQAGDFEVVVQVQDSADEPASSTQEFTITVASLDTPLETMLTVKKVINGTDLQNMSQENKIASLKDSDDKRLEVPGSTSMTCIFSDADLPEGATIASMDITIEHFEDKGFADKKLQWKIGTGWPDNPEVWFSIDAPIHNGQDEESSDSWEVTSIVDSLEKLSSFQLQISNSNNISSQKTSINNISVIVKWY